MRWLLSLLRYDEYKSRDLSLSRWVGTPSFGFTFVKPDTPFSCATIDEKGFRKATLLHEERHTKAHASGRASDCSHPARTSAVNLGTYSVEKSFR